MVTYRDMNGIWSGMYDYVYSGDVVKFTAWFDDRKGTLSGSSIEPNSVAFMGVKGDELPADLEGAREGVAVTFSKVYSRLTGIRQPPVIYEGEADADFTQVRGVWRVKSPTDMTGRFALMRMAKGVHQSTSRLRAALVTISGLSDT